MRHNIYTLCTYLKIYILNFNNDWFIQIFNIIYMKTFSSANLDTEGAKKLKLIYCRN